VARLRRFLMLERARQGEEAEAAAPRVSARFESLEAPAPEADDRFAPPRDPDVALEVAARDEKPVARDEALAAEIAAMAACRDQIAVEPAEERYPRAIDRVAAALAVGPLAGWTPRGRIALVVGAVVAAIGALCLVHGIGPRVFQAALALLLFALFIRS